MAGTGGRVVCLAALALALTAAGAQAAVITVTTATDELTMSDGTVSLREAITAIDAGNSLGDPDITGQNPGTFGSDDTIEFDIPGTGRQTISVGSGSASGGLPPITKPVTINGYSQPGASTNQLGGGDNAKLLIALDGTSAGSSSDGLEADASGVRVVGLDIFNFSLSQIELRRGHDTVAGDELGYDASGAPTQSQTGVTITQSSDSLIGGATPAARNVISGNTRSGVVIAGTTSRPAQANDVQGNFIGTTPSGLAAAGNAGSAPYGGVGAVLVDGGSANTIGGTTTAARNVISGNGAGINIRNGGHFNAVQGNLIGVAANGHSALPNRGYGVRIGSSGTLSPPGGPGQPHEPPTSQNVVGALAGFPSTGTGNVIAFNGGDGVLIQGTPQHNSVQLENSGNSVLSDSIYSNHGLAIHLERVKGGRPPNNLISAPRVTGVRPGQESSTVRGSVALPGRPHMSLLVQLYASAGCGAAAWGQGQTLLGSVGTRTNASGGAAFSAHVASLSPGQIVTATTTNTSADRSVHDASAKVLDTSEFSRCFRVPRRPSATTVGCRPASVATGSQTRCTATVTDRASGPKRTPRGTVRFSTSATGSFSHRGVCRLSGGQCTVVYRPKRGGSGSQRITARYGGDSLHTVSSGHVRETVTRGH